ncbi:MAG: hypothetical protein MMC23_006333 [Stictis urceolatum]|nr:hypothetical protein [Stictis urceolata]
MASQKIKGVDVDKGVDLELYPTARKLASRCQEFFSEVENINHRTPGKDLEARLNKDYGPGNAYYDDFCKLVKQGLDEGWVASGELDGKKYRRGKICLPTPESRYFSITTVYSMDSNFEGSVLDSYGLKLMSICSGKRGGVLRPISCTPLRRDQLCSTARRDCGAERHARMAGCGLDFTRPWDTPLSSSP